MNLSFLKFDLGGRFKETFYRFPFVMIFAVFTTIAFNILIERSDSEFFINWIIVSFIGFLSLLVWSLASESYHFQTRTFYIGILVISILLAIYYSFVSRYFSFSGHPCFLYFTFGLSLILHILVGLVPFLAKRDDRGFLEFNTSLFVAWMQAAFMSLVLYGTLSLSIIALDTLFDLHIGFNIYAHLFVLIAGLFHTSIFLSDVPDFINSVTSEKTYSIFKKLIWYVIVPSLYLFGLILFAYLIKSLINPDIYSGEISIILLLWYFLIGICAWLFVQYFSVTSSGYMTFFRGYFYLFSSPLILGIIYHVYRLIDYRAVTEADYFMAACTSFIVSTALYFWVKRDNLDFRAWPLFLLVILSVATIIPPFTICQVPIKSQQKRLIFNLEKRGNIIDGHLVNVSHQKLQSDTTNQISTAIYFLSYRNELEYIRNYDRDGLLPKDTITSENMLEIVGLSYDNQSEGRRQLNMSQISNGEDIKGWDQWIPIVDKYGDTTKGASFQIDNVGMGILYIDGAKVGSYDLSQKLIQMDKDSTTTQRSIPIKIGSHELKIILSSANGNVIDESRIEDLSVMGFVLVRF